MPLLAPVSHRQGSEYNPRGTPRRTVAPSDERARRVLPRTAGVHDSTPSVSTSLAPSMKSGSVRNDSHDGHSSMMANDNSLGVFLKDRRARLDPAAFGLSPMRRRTPGLRREEVASRADISAVWYTPMALGY